MTLVTRVCRHAPLVWRHTSWADRLLLKVIFFIAAAVAAAYLYHFMSTKTNKTVSIGHWAILAKVPEQVLPGIYQVEFKISTEMRPLSAIVAEEVVSTNEWRVGDRVFVHKFISKNYEGTPTTQYGITHWDPQTNASMARVGK